MHGNHQNMKQMKEKRKPDIFVIILSWTWMTVVVHEARLCVCQTFSGHKLFLFEATRRRLPGREDVGFTGI